MIISRRRGPKPAHGSGPQPRRVRKSADVTSLPARMPVRLLKEFDAMPVGPHSPELQRILNALRGGPLAGKYVLVCLEPHREWVLGRLSGQRGGPVEILPDQRFTRVADAERAVFRLRWKERTGQSLD